ncbi:MFS general substrate transporter [Amniculicola lignicola CBS 123094]|uniref:MFS general substrate transporter n=1 Tax=Amniculicola lignicola CBS 123094 TaxID=1392246 RepID=A0A6A5WPV2_9PLEO|nr:MFS general substrate transporter [Amniculicola lignicola CBS 123094]
MVFSERFLSVAPDLSLVSTYQRINGSHDSEPEPPQESRTQLPTDMTSLSDSGAPEIFAPLDRGYSNRDLGTVKSLASRVLVLSLSAELNPMYGGLLSLLLVREPVAPSDTAFSTTHFAARDRRDGGFGSATAGWEEGLMPDEDRQTNGHVTADDAKTRLSEKEVGQDEHEKGTEASSEHDATPVATNAQDSTDSSAKREAPTPPHHEKEAAVDSTAGASKTATADTGVDANEDSAEEPEDESKYLSGVKLWILSLGLCLTTFVIALDNTIIATAIPKITTVFNSLDDVGWYGSSYLLTTCSLQPSFGKVYTYFDVKYTYLFALLLFEVGSIICAAATNSPMFIIGRAVAGAGAAALFSGGMTIIGYSVPLRKRPIYIAALSSMFGIASVVGPILGGTLTDNVSWRWCFWINLPFGGVSLAVVFFFFSNPERQYSHVSVRNRIKELDLPGAVFLICAIVCLLLALQWGGQTYPWRSSKVWGTLLGFGLLIPIFICIQFYQKDRATIPVRVFKKRTVLVSCVFSALLSMALYTHIFYLPFYFQAIKGTTAEESGIRTIAYLVSITVASIIVGGSITFLGYYTPFMWAGSAIFTVGAGLLYTLHVNSPPKSWISYQVLAGIGAGASVQIPFVAVQVVTNTRDMPIANAMVMFFNSLGGAISISIAQNIFVNSLSREIPRYAPGVEPKRVIGAGATYVRELLKNLGMSASLPGVLEAYNNAIVSAFIVAIATSGIAFVISFGMEWKSVKGKKIVTGGAA